MLTLDIWISFVQLLVIYPVMWNLFVDIVFSSCSLTIIEISLFRWFTFPHLSTAFIKSANCPLSFYQLQIFDIFFHWFWLMQLELFLSSGTVCLSIYSLVAAIFGMNIPYTWNKGHGHIFKWVRNVFQVVNKVISFTLIFCRELFFLGISRWYLWLGCSVHVCSC